MVKEMVKTLFPATKNIDEVVGIIDKYRMKFGLNTDMRLAQFLAQVREEVGPEFKVIRESLNYKEEAVLKMWPNRISISDAEKYARDEDTPKANQEAIASLALVPDWYMYILVGLVTVIYGMRGMLKMALQIIGSKFKIKKDKEPK